MLKRFSKSCCELVMKIDFSPLRKFTIILVAVALCWTTVACGGSPSTNQSLPSQNVTQTRAATRLNTGEYPVQQARYNDANGEYSLVLLDTPPGTPSVFNTADLQMARLTPEEVAAGKKSYLKVDNGQASLHLTEDFKIEYIHAVTETRPDPQTGQPQTIIVREERGGFWAPFAGAVAGNVVGNLLFRPQYYVPPVYQPGVSVMNGYGGYGRTYDQAVGQYQTRYQAAPPAVTNRRAANNFRTTGRVRSYPGNEPSVNRPSQINTGNRPSGSGFGSSTLRQSGKSSPSRVERSSGSFGSGVRSRPSGARRTGSFGRRR